MPPPIKPARSPSRGCRRSRSSRPRHNQKNCGREVPGGLAWVMTISLYDLSVPTFLQTMRAVSGFLDRAAKHAASATDPPDFARARLYSDMAPFHFQIEALTHHAVWGLEAVKTGVFAPPRPVGAMPFTDLRAIVGQAVTALEAFTP